VEFNKIMVESIHFLKYLIQSSNKLQKKYNEVLGWAIGNNQLSVRMIFGTWKTPQ